MKTRAFFHKFAQFLDRRALWVSAFFLVIFAFATLFTIQLYGTLRTDIEEMLPTTSRSVLDLKEVTKRLRAIDNLAVLIFSQNSQAAGKLQQDLATEFAKIPSSVSAGVEYKITDEVDFFKKRKALFISKSDLNDIQAFIKKKIDYEKFIYNPVNLVIEDKPKEPTFSFNDLEKKYASRTDEYSHFPGGIYATPDGTNRLVIVYVADEKVEGAHALKNAVAEIVNRLDPKKYAPDMEVKYSSGVQDIIEEEASVMRDLVLSTVVVTILVALVLLLYYRSFYATMALIFSLLVGTMITLGISRFLVGNLNANSAFLGSIIMGNGINFGIMVLARYLEERRSRRQEHVMALEIAMSETIMPTFAAAIAAAIAYGSLMLTSFRGFSQFGVIGFLGMVVCWFCAYTFFPAALSVLNRFVSLVGKDRRTESRSLWASGLKFMLIHLPKPMAIAGLVLTVFAGIAISQINKSIIETDLTKLRDKTSMTEGSGFLSQYVELILKRNTTPIAVMTHKPEEAEKLEARLLEIKERDGPKSIIGSVMRIQDFVPPNQQEKIRALRSIQEQLPPKIYWSLPETDKLRVKEFLSTETLKPFTMADLPPKLLDRFREKDGTIGNLVLVEPPLTDEIRQGDALLKFVKDIRDSVDEIAPHSPVAGRLPISADMLAAVLKDGPIATAVAAAAVVLLTIVLFRNIELSLLVLSALFIGVAWMLAGLHWFHLKINFLNFIALPITFGIGVDYSVNVFHRYREEKEKEAKRRQNGDAEVYDVAGESPIVRAVYHTGGAVVLASMTTTIGWSSLMLAGNQAFVSFGRIAMIGEVTCVTVAVLLIPSFLIWLQGRKKIE